MSREAIANAGTLVVFIALSFLNNNLLLVMLEFKTMSEVEIPLCKKQWQPCQNLLDPSY